MTDSARAIHNFANLESVLNTDELNVRARPPNYETENRALIAISRHIADCPGALLQNLAEVVLETCNGGSALVSLLSEETGDFQWPAVAGAWQPHIGEVAPRHFAPCGVVLDRDAEQLFTHPERYYSYLASLSPPIAEALLTPFYVKGKAVGTVWVIAHDNSRRFDAEDARLLRSLSGFAAAAYPICAALDKQESQAHSLRDVNEGLLLSSVHQHELREQAQKAESVLREIEERLRLAGSAAEVGTWRLDLHTLLDTRDANYNLLLGLPQVDSMQPLDDFLNRLHPEDRSLVEAEMEKAVRERGPYKVECRIILPDGTVRWLLTQGHVIASDGEPLYITGAAVDITLQKGVESTLRMANQDLEQFGYSASHDLQEPIRNISIYGDLLRKHYGHLLDAEGKSLLASITAGAKRMEMLLIDLRSYAQSGGNETELRVEVQADDVLAKTLTDLASAIAASGATISHDKLPTLLVHEVQLAQIFQNLIGNAIKYRRDEEPPRIFVSATCRQDQWTFSVKDNGIGIAAEHRRRIFGIFKRLHGGEKYAGSGIGLAICQRIVERNGGRIWVESEGQDKGSTFYFNLPPQVPVAIKPQVV